MTKLEVNSKYEALLGGDTLSYWDIKEMSESFHRTAQRCRNYNHKLLFWERYLLLKKLLEKMEDRCYVFSNLIMCDM